MKRVIPPLCIAIMALVIAVQSSRRQAEERQQHGGPGAAPPSMPCPDKQRAWVDGLDVGQSLGDYRVIAFRCAEPKVMEIDLRHEVLPLTLIVAEPNALPHSAPRQTKGHDLFYNRKTPENEPPTQQEIDALLVLLANRVESSEKKQGSGK